MSSRPTIAILRPALLAAVAASLSLPPVAGAAGPARAGEDALVWFVAPPAGQPLARDADRAVNPASLTKLATTLWALETLGPDHRFTTRFALTGPVVADGGIVKGDLVVDGDDDPDFHVENAWLVARQLNDAGVREIAGDLLVDDGFSIGWEHGSEGRRTDATERATLMAERLRRALDPARWDAATRESWNDFAGRRGLDPQAPPPAIVVRGAAGRFDGPAPPPIVVHRSNPLPVLLRRFNVYSNNDIERLGATLGSPAELASFIGDRLDAPGGAVRFETLSGLGSNRMTPRLVVALLARLRATAVGDGLALRDLLPVAGCDPGTLHHYPGLEDTLRGRLVAKTGTLAQTDGGVAALAGVADTVDGPWAFCVVAPAAGARLSGARDDEADWLIRRVGAAAAAAPERCGPGVAFSDDEADVGIVRGPGR